MGNKAGCKVGTVICIIALCAGLLWGCGPGEPGGNNEEMGSPIEKKKVVLIAKSTESSFWKSVFSGASAAATEYHMELITEGPGNEEDYQTQNQMIEEAVAEGTDAIVISAIDFEENAAAINKAAKQGVKIIVIDSDVNSKNVECRIGTDNYKAGQMAGRVALSGTQPNLYIGVVNFDKITENGQSREKGLCETLQKDSRAIVVDTVNARSTIDSAKEKTINMLKRHPEINILVTFNEWTSLGVGYAIRELGAGDRIDVIAFDSNVVSVDMLETGEVDALIVQNPYAMGYLGVENAYKALNGYEIEDTEIKTASRLVTKENMYSEECQRILFSLDETK